MSPDLLGKVRRCRALTDRAVDVTPTLDGFDVAVHRIEVRAHRHDGYVAPPSLAPRRNIVRPLVVPATVLLDGLEAECIGIPSDLEQFSHDPRLDLDRFGLSPARNRKPFPILAARSNAASLKPPSQMGIFRFGRGIFRLCRSCGRISWSTTGCSHSLRIKAICCSCRLPRRRKCPDISRPSYSTQFQPIPTPRRSRPSENRSTSAACWRKGPSVAAAG